MKKVLKPIVMLFAFIITLAACNAESEPDLYAPFRHSEGINENGYWDKVNALDYVELFDYKALSVPASVHAVPDEALQEEINNMLSYFPVTRNEIYDRPIKNGDLVNIDYIGYIDGEEFQGGNSQGEGADVTAGSAQFIDDFLTQIIGRSPGETFDVEVSFPDPYPNNPDLAGLPALFVTTINYIIDAKLTDEFVTENLSDIYGWYTVEDVEEGIRGDIRQEALDNFLYDFLTEQVTVKSIPDSLIQYQKRLMADYYLYYADFYNMEIGDFVKEFLNADSLEDYMAENAENLEREARYSLILQAIAEDAGITVSTDDLAEFFTEFYQSPDYSEFVNDFGLGYVKQVVLHYKVKNLIFDNAVYE